jgi:hypothetical protein
MAVTHFSTSESAAQTLMALGARIAGKPESLVGLYIPESTEPEYNSDKGKYSRVAALVRMLPMPANKRINDYPSKCLIFKNGSIVDRWPIGWPAEVVFYSQYGGPVLRDAVYKAEGIVQLRR